MLAKVDDREIFLELLVSSPLVLLSNSRAGYFDHVQMKDFCFHGVASKAIQVPRSVVAIEKESQSLGEGPIDLLQDFCYQLGVKAQTVNDVGTPVSFICC